MTIKIGDKEYSTRRPQDLDKQLIEATGCNAEETARFLGGAPLAMTIARALLPFLPEGDRPDMATLAGQIEAAGRVEVATQVAKLYAPVVEPVAEPKTPTK